MDMNKGSLDEVWGEFRATRSRARSTSCIPDEGVRGPVLDSKTQQLFTQVCERNDTIMRRIQGGAMTETVLEASYPPSIQPSRDLQQMMINDLIRGEHHRGKRLLLRIIQVSWGCSTINAIVEDETGTQIVLQFFHCPNGLQGLAGDPIMMGQSFVLKEPFLHASNDPITPGKHCLRVDHITDVVWLDMSDSRLPTGWDSVATKYRDMVVELGPRAWIANGASDWADLVGFASDMIASAKNNEERRIGYLHRSVGNANLGRAEIALGDALKAMGCGGMHPQVLLYQARALSALGEYDKALSTLGDLTQRWPSMVGTANEIDSVNSRNQEHIEGEYNFGEMYRQAALVPPLIKCATFSSLVRVQPSSGRGMGLFTTHPVSAGDIVLCEKALGYAYSKYGSTDPTTAATGLTYLHNAETLFFGGQARLLSDLIQKLRYTPALLDEHQFSQLYHGDYKPVSAGSSVDGQPVVDTFHVAEVIAVSGMGAPRTSLGAFRTKGDEAPASHYASCGLWPLASRMNHSCLPNCRRSFIGDMLILRATRDLAAGAELEISYRGGSRALAASDRKWLMDTWGFACRCELCTSSHASPSDKLWHQLEGLDRKSKRVLAAKADTTKVKERLSRMMDKRRFKELERAINQPFDFDLDHAAFRVKLASIILRVGDSWDAIGMGLSGLQLLGFLITSSPLREGVTTEPHFCVHVWGVATDSALDAFLLLLRAYKSAYPPLLPMLRPYALKMYSMVIGEETTAADEISELKPEAN